MRQMNARRDIQVDLSANPIYGARLHRFGIGSFSIPLNGAIVTGMNAVYDPYGLVSGSPNYSTITVGVTGNYYLACWLHSENGVGGWDIGPRIYVDGVNLGNGDFKVVRAGGIGFTSYQYACMRSLNAGQYVQLNAYTDRGVGTFGDGAFLEVYLQPLFEGAA